PVRGPGVRRGRRPGADRPPARHVPCRRLARSALPPEPRDNGSGAESLRARKRAPGRTEPSHTNTVNQRWLTVTLGPDPSSLAARHAGGPVVVPGGWSYVGLTRPRRRRGRARPLSVSKERTAR